MEHLTLAHVVLTTSLAVLLYSYAGYPLILAVLAHFRRDGEERVDDPAPWPTVTVVISAFNEEAVIGRRIENLLEVDYPRDRLQILIGSDGSTDATCDVVGRYRFAGVRLLEFTSRRGKASVLNDLVARAAGEYVVFTDANTFFDRDAIKELIRGFRACASACAVVGRLECRTAEGTVNPEGLYWRFETALKRLESRFGSVLGANGGIYAILRAGFRPLPSDTIVDDFLLPMLMRLESGGPVIFRPSAKAWETVAETVRDEFRRRMRIGAGDAHALVHTWRLLLPDHGMLALSYWSHKVLRWMGPGLLLAALVANFFLLDTTWGRALLATQVLGYTLGLAAPLVGHLPVIGRLAIAAWFFTVVNAGILIGTVKFLAGRAAPTWQTTPRSAEAVVSSAEHLGDRKLLREVRVDRPAA